MKKSALNFQSNAKTAYYKALPLSLFGLIMTKPNTIEEFLLEDIFENPLFTTENHTFSKEYNNWKEAGVIKVRDIFHETENKVLTKHALETKFGLPIDDMKYNRLSNSVSKTMKKLARFPIIDRFSPILFAKKCTTNIARIKSADVNNFFVLKNYKVPSNQDKWVNYYPFLDTFDWADIYILAPKVTFDTYLITLQFKILHGIYNCNYNLFVWNIKASSQCNFCLCVDNLEHFFSIVQYLIHSGCN